MTELDAVFNDFEQYLTTLDEITDVEQSDCKEENGTEVRMFKVTVAADVSPAFFQEDLKMRLYEEFIERRSDGYGYDSFIFNTWPDGTDTVLVAAAGG